MLDPAPMSALEAAGSVGSRCTTSRCTTRLLPDSDAPCLHLRAGLHRLTLRIPPFYSQNVNEMYNKIQHGVLRFPPFLSEPCKAIIVGLLNRDPKKRLGSNSDVDDLRAHPFFASINFDDMMAN